MSGPDTNIQWFIARDGKQHGPISDIEIRKLVELSHLKPTDLVWCQGFSDWRSAGSVFPIVEAASQPAPQAAAAPHGASPAPGPGPGPAATPSPGQGPSPASPAGSTPGSASPGGPAASHLAPSHPTPQAGGHPSHAPNPMKGPGPAPGSAQQPYSPFGGTQPGPRSGGPIDARPAPTRPLGSPVAPGPFTTPGAGPAPSSSHASGHGPGHAPGHGPGPGPGQSPGPGLTPGLGAMPGPGPRPTADMRRPSDISVPPRAPERASGGKRRGLVIAAGLISMTAAGAWLASQHKEAIFAFVQSAEDADKPAGEPQQAGATASLPTPPKQPEATATATPVAAVAPAPDEMDRKLQARPMWVTVKQQLPEIYQAIVTQAARMTAEGKPQAEVTAFLVTELVKMRRENAQHALAASTARHKELAAAFLANLNELSRESGDGCYEFISRGENSQAILSRIDDPARSTQIEAQVVAIVQAIVEGKAQPASHPAPVKQDYDVLAGELGRLGWTQADMQLFANPKELAKAPRARVCSMLKDWFTAHLAIQDPSTQERLLFETLKPVVAG